MAKTTMQVCVCVCVCMCGGGGGGRTYEDVDGDVPIEGVDDLLQVLLLLLLLLLLVHVVRDARHSPQRLEQQLVLARGALCCVLQDLLQQHRVPRNALRETEREKGDGRGDDSEYLDR